MRARYSNNRTDTVKTHSPRHILRISRSGRRRGSRNQPDEPGLVTDRAPRHDANRERCRRAPCGRPSRFIMMEQARESRLRPLGHLDEPGSIGARNECGRSPAGCVPQSFLLPAEG